MLSEDVCKRCPEYLKGNMGKGNWVCLIAGMNPVCEVNEVPRRCQLALEQLLVRQSEYPMPSKRVCRICAAETRPNAPVGWQEGVWTERDERMWSEGKVLCPAQGWLLQHTDKPVEEACGYVLEHIVAQEAKARAEERQHDGPTARDLQPMRSRATRHQNGG